MLLSLHRSSSSAFAAPSLSFDSGDVHRSAVDGVMHSVGRRVSRTLLRSTSLIAERDEQRSDVLAVSAIARSECRTRAARSETRRRQLQRYLVRLRVVAAHVASRTGVLDDDVFDRAPANVVVTAQVGARSE